MKCSTYIVKALEKEGVEVVFGYPGGAIMPLYDALIDARFKHILVRHEQGAALAADGYARATGKVGVCLATSGPGATNLLTGIANAHLDSVPMLVITGQVATSFMGTDAFQEVDVLGMSMPIVKHSFLPKKASEVPEMLAEAFHIARTGRPGPVLFDLPKDVSIAEVPHTLVPQCGTAAGFPPDEAEVQKALELLQSSERPVIYAGGGIGMGRMIPQFRYFMRKTGIPTVTTLKGVGAVPGDYERHLGMLGMHGTEAANHAVQESDLLIVIGARLDDRATGKLATFAPEAKVIHMDIDPAEMSKLRTAHACLVGTLERGLEALSIRVDIEPWLQRCMQLKREFAWDYNAPGKGIYAPKLIRDISLRAGDDTVITCDVGQHQMWVAQHYLFRNPEYHLTSGGLGTMGFGIPAAIGACFGLPDHRVIAMTGDGSIMMNIQELATIARYQLPVKILLFDNQRLGLVRQWQELFFQERFSEVDLSDNPDFVEVANAFGIPAFRIQERDETEMAIDRLLNQEGPLLVHCLIDPSENVWPLVAPGKSNAEMMTGVEK